MSLAMKPLLPPPPAETFQPEKVVQDVLANADPSLAEAVREFVAAQPGDWKGPVIAVITESAEPVYVNDKRDTVEASPLAKLAAEIDASPVAKLAAEVEASPREKIAEAAPVLPVVADTTESVVVRFEETAPVEAIAHAVPTTAATADTQKVDPEQQTIDHEPPPVPERPTARSDEQPPVTPSESGPSHEPDKVAEERGVPPLRMPKLSAAFVPIRDAVRSLSSRTVVIASVSVATVSVAVAVGAVMWARGAVADTSHDVAPPSEAIAPAAIEPLPAPHLAAQPPATQGACVLTVRASHPEAIVWLDGTQLGVAPQTITGDCNRSALVEVRHPRYADFKRQLAVDGNLEIDARLEREKTELTVWSEPAGAEVLYEGRVLGTTPLTTTVNRYEQGELHFRAAGYEADWRRIVPKQAKKTVAITLKKVR